jgi:hypothetical protein
MPRGPVKVAWTEGDDGASRWRQDKDLDTNKCNSDELKQETNGGEVHVLGLWKGP